MRPKAEHARLLAWEQEWLEKLELAYRVIDVAAGDLGLSAQRKFDCEAWVPTQGRYRELTDLDLELHRLPDPPPRHPRPLKSTKWAEVKKADRHPQRHPGRHPPHHRGAAGDPPAGRRLGAGAEGAAALPAGSRRPRSHRWLRSSQPSVSDAQLLEGLEPVPDGWQPRLVALDIDGTLLKWVEGTGQNYEQIAPAVYDAVHAAVDAGAHIVLASGRSPHGCPPSRTCSTCPARATTDCGWSPPTEPWCSATRRSRSCTRRPSTPARRSRRCSSSTPRPWSPSRNAASATGSTGPSPTGELSGEMIETELDDIVAGR